MNNKEIYYFIGKCLALDDHPEFSEEIVKLFKTNNIDWDHFIGFCSDHLILQVIFLKFESHNLIDFIPEELAQHLKTIHELNVDRNRLITRQLLEIGKALGSEDIQPIFLKGSGNLLHNVYSDVGERIMSDIDFLVIKDDFIPAAECMKSIDYEQVFESEEWFDLSKAKHYPRLYNQKYAADIEIHRIPSNEKYTKWYNTDVVDNEKVAVEDVENRFVPCDKHKIIHNFVHSQLADEGHLLGMISLREVYDLYLLSKRYSVKETLQYIKPKQKAIAYFAFADTVLGMNGGLFLGKNLAYQILIRKHSLNLKSNTFRKTFHTVIFLWQRIMIGYIWLGISFFFSKEKRKYFISRITNRDWYSNHLKLYSGFFKGKK